MAQLPDGIKITWCGHSTFLLQTPSGKRLLIDPFLQDNPACPEHLKDPGPLDAILVTHGHGDHMGDLVGVAKKTGATVVCIADMYYWLATKKGVDNVIDMNIGGTAEVAGCKVHMTHAIHSSGYMDGDTLVYLGSPVGYVIEFENGFRVYHAGDTAVFGDMALIGKLLAPDLAMLPIGDHYTQGPRSAAESIRLLGVKKVVPMHFGTFPVLTGTPDALRKETSDIDGLEILELEPGETLS